MVHSLSSSVTLPRTHLGLPPSPSVQVGDRGVGKTCLASTNLPSIVPFAGVRLRLTPSVALMPA
jgi:hypothetical protein